MLARGSAEPHEVVFLKYRQGDDASSLARLEVEAMRLAAGAMHGRVRTPACLGTVFEHDRSAVCLEYAGGRTLASLQGAAAYWADVFLVIDWCVKSAGLRVDHAESAREFGVRDLSSVAAPALCHGDLGPMNLIVRAADVVVVDWEHACVTHPLADAMHLLLLCLIQAESLSIGQAVAVLTGETPDVSRRARAAVSRLLAALPVRGDRVAALRCMAAMAVDRETGRTPSQRVAGESPSADWWRAVGATIEPHAR